MSGCERRTKGRTEDEGQLPAWGKWVSFTELRTGRGMCWSVDEVAGGTLL